MNAPKGDTQVVIVYPETFPQSSVATLLITRNSVGAYLARGQAGVSKVTICRVEVVGYKKPGDGRYIKILEELEVLPPHLIGKNCSECGNRAGYYAKKCDKCSVVFEQFVEMRLNKYPLS